MLCRVQRFLSLCLVFEAGEVVSRLLLEAFPEKYLRTMFVINCDGVSGPVGILILRYHHWDF